MGCSAYEVPETCLQNKGTYIMTTDPLRLLLIKILRGYPDTC
jgi:hypothetical protein